MTDDRLLVTCPACGVRQLLAQTTVRTSDGMGEITLARCRFCDTVVYAAARSASPEARGEAYGEKRSKHTS